MWNIVLSDLLFIVFTVLSGFHFYWLLGGKFGAMQAIPTTEKGANPGKIPIVATIVVALGLLAIGVLYILNAHDQADLFPSARKIALWIVPILFFTRAIGEFKYVGFFKRIKDTEFAKADTKLYSPLCLGIAVVGFLILVLS